MFIAKGSDWLRQLQSQLMEVSTFINDFDDNATLIIYFEETKHELYVKSE